MLWCSVGCLDGWLVGWPDGWSVKCLALCALYQWTIHGPSMTMHEWRSLETDVGTARSHATSTEWLIWLWVRFNHSQNRQVNIPTRTSFSVICGMSTRGTGSLHPQPYVISKGGLINPITSKGHREETTRIHIYICLYILYCQSSGVIFIY